MNGELFEKFVSLQNTTYLSTYLKVENDKSFWDSLRRFYNIEGRSAVYSLKIATNQDLIQALKLLNYTFIKLKQKVPEVQLQSNPWYQQQHYDEIWKSNVKAGKPQYQRFNPYKAWGSKKETDDEIIEEFYELLLNDDTPDIGHNIIRSITLTPADTAELTKRYDALPVANEPEELNWGIEGGERRNTPLTDRIERDRKFFKKRVVALARE